MSTATDITREHYNRPEIKKIITSLSQDDAYCRWGNGDGHGWYKYNRNGKYAYNLSIEQDYKAITDKYRTLYWTLNYFDARIYEQDYTDVTSEESPLISRQYTQGYTLGVDIDKGHGCDIRDPEVKQAVEDMGQFYTDKLREHAPNSIHCLFSGGGIYVMLHHRAIEAYFRKFINSNEWEHYFNILIKAYGYVIENIRKEFFKQYPQHEGKVKPDSLNNSKRVFKSIFSLHLKQPYAVIPLDPDNIKIDFDKAKLPLSSEVIESGKRWYQSYDTDNGFLKFMGPYLEKAKHELDKSMYLSKSGGNGAAFDIEADVSNKIICAENWPPCVKNVLALEKCGEGRTRALAFIAAFLGQVGIPEDQAKEIFYGLAKRWGATTSNVFESWYRRTKVASCDKIRADNNTGYPGVSLKCLNVCKPEPRCINLPSPRYYADKEANIKRLRNKLTKTNISNKK
ncbi:hypothetical protein [Methanolobus sp. WCC5]|uniref:hypothetical protein n=1 Tax=Methanolobus sp. WCC5 TaxID=3125785 RepID=UPI003246AE05